MIALRRPIAHVWTDANGRIGVAVPCNLDRLSERDRDAVDAIDRADRAMVTVAGGHRRIAPFQAERRPGYVTRGELVLLTAAGWTQHQTRVATIALAACMSLEASGYDVRESTLDSRVADLVRRHAPIGGRR